MIVLQATVTIAPEGRGTVVESHAESDHIRAFQGRIPEFVAGDVEHRFDATERSRMR
jgi:hypothetical protein